ncbi:glycoside hydrolase family 2 [Alginatibacterium sediminis]|uniref:beta-mannosidase n=1 Tax=Alginatibacterium sediminis TaxID=2164068 RepID=A0A420EB99_9ALTE|nr:sugar-binding domain-containing protein [Alginatibacterium sediminis]RKF17956.1 glycoside hydrolase family 2 [Alginatibacterium sediminis]
MSRKIIDLSGNHWQMERMRPGQGVEEQFHLLPAEYQGTTFSWNFASIPGDVYTDLYKAGEIEDPYFGRNMHKAKWVGDYEWWYTHRFNVDELLSGKQFRLVFSGVDYSCEIWLNGIRLGEHEGMFSSFDFDISEYVNLEQWRGGSNILMIKLNPPPKNYRNCGGKKVNFSGDYFTGLVPFGIWRPIHIEVTEAVRLNDYRVDFKLQGSDAAAVLSFETENMTDIAQSYQAKCVFKGHNFSDTDPVIHSFPVTVQPGQSEQQCRITLEDAKLWWPWDMGDQNLYELEITLEKDTVVIDRLQDVVGVREVTMEMNPGFTQEEAEYPWTFMINGRRHFLRSACWGGQPSFFYGRNSLEKYQDRVKAVRDANINNLRIFGWHPPETPEFYRLCDELGITVWTNFTLATQAYPSDESFVSGVIHECVSTVKERRNHPSLIFWMGGEEVFFSGAHEESGNKQLMLDIGDAVAELTDVPYGLASPLSSASAVNLGFKTKESIHANEHYYGGGIEFMEEYYPSLDCAIIPELTAASAPCVESLAKFIPEDELWPMGLSWGYHWADIDILKNLNFEVFNDFKMGSLEEFVEATQIAQGTVLQFALETYRRRKPKMSGVSLCHFITHWPDIKWGIVDYYGEKKISYDYVYKAYQPLLPSLEFEKRRWNPGSSFVAKIWIVNDFHHSYAGLTLTWEILASEQELATGTILDIDVLKDSSKLFEEIECLIPEHLSDSFTVVLKLKDGDSVLSSNRYELLIGDQSLAKQRSLEHLALSKKNADKYGLSVYRYWPEHWNLD